MFRERERETERGKYKKYQSSDMIPALKKKIPAASDVPSDTL